MIEPRVMWMLDLTAYWTEKAGDLVTGPFYRSSRWASREWWRRDRIRQAKAS